MPHSEHVPWTVDNLVSTTLDLAAMLLQYLIANVICHNKIATCTKSSDKPKFVGCKKEPQVVLAEVSTLSNEHN